MSKRIIVLSALGVAVSGYYIFFRDRDDLVPLFIIALLTGTIGYIFQYQIDQLMTRGTAQHLDKAMREMLIHTSRWFSELPMIQKFQVEDRMQRWVMKKDFINKNEQDAPEDCKYLLAYYAVLLTLHQESYQYEGLDRIAFYHHPFLSPEHPDDVHIAEVEIEDGTLIISVPHLIKGHLERGYYNIALHVMAEAYQRVYLKEKINWPADIWDQLEAISTISRDQIDAYIGLQVNDPWPVCVHHQVMYKGTSIPEVERLLPQLKPLQSGPEAVSSI